MKTLRKRMIIALFVVFVACLVMPFALFNNQYTVNAIGEDKDLFTMEKGASVSLLKDGLRFRVKMGENVYDKIVTNDVGEKVSLSVLVAPKILFDKVNDGKYLNLEKKIEIPFEDESKIYFYNGFYWANAVLTNLNKDNNLAITDSQFDLSFVAIGVIKEVGQDPIYATFCDNDIANNTRTQYDVLQSAVLDPDNAEGAMAILDSATSPYSSWFGGDDYPIVIDNLDKFNGLVCQVGNGVNFNVNIEIQDKFDIPETPGVILPETVKTKHYVNFYNDQVLLETVEVLDGQPAVCSKTIPAYKGLEAMDGGYVRGYKNGGNWIDGSKNVLDLTEIHNSVDAHVNWVWGDHTNVLKEDATNEEPKTFLFFDREVGVAQIGMGHGAGATDGAVSFVRSYDTQVKWGNEKGSTKIYFKNTQYNGKYSNPWINISPVSVTKSEGDWVAFYAKLDFSSEVNYVDIKHNNTPGVRIMNGEWGLVMFPANNFGSSPLRIEFSNKNSSDGTSSGSLYFSKATLISASEAVDLTKVADDTTWELGNTTLKNSVGLFSYDGISSKGKHDKTPNDAVFSQDFNFSPFLINGELFYYHQANKDGAVILTFNEIVTGKIYVTARGLADTPKMQIFNASGAHQATPAGSIVNTLADGYKVYEFNFGTNQIGSVRLFTGYGTSGVFRQIAIRDITIGTK